MTHDTVWHVSCTKTCSVCAYKKRPRGRNNVKRRTPGEAVKERSSARSRTDESSHDAQVFPTPANGHDDADQASANRRRIDSENRHSALDQFCGNARSSPRSSLFRSAADRVLTSNCLDRRLY